jgi:hypothetical protein
VKTQAQLGANISGVLKRRSLTVPEEPIQSPGTLQRRQKILIVIAAALATLTVVATSVWLWKADRGYTAITRKTIVDQTHKAVLTQLLTDSTVTFGSDTETQVTPEGGQRYFVRGWVKAIRASGEWRGYEYTCSIAREGSTWDVSNLIILPLP